MAGKPTRAPAEPTVTLTWAIKDWTRKTREGPRVPATDGAGVIGADHGCAGGLRKHRFLGRGEGGRWLARTVRRRKQQQLFTDRRGQHIATRVEAFGQRRARRPGGARFGQLPRRERAIGGRMLSDGVGERQQGTPTLVHPAGAGRRTVQSFIRWVRQSLYRPAGRDAVLPADAVDPVASS